MDSLFICDDVWSIILSYVSNIPRLSLINKNSYLVCQRLYATRILYLIDKYMLYSYDVYILFNLLAYRGDWDDFLILWHNLRGHAFTEAIALEYGRLDILDFMCKKKSHKLHCNDIRLYHMWHSKHAHRFKETRRYLSACTLQVMHYDMRKYISTKSSINQGYEIFFEDSDKYDWFNKLAITKGLDYQRRESVLASLDDSQVHHVSKTQKDFYRYLLGSCIITPTIVQRCIELRKSISDKFTIRNKLLGELIRTEGNPNAICIVLSEFDNPKFRYYSKEEILKLFDNLDQKTKIELVIKYPSIKFDLQIDAKEYISILQRLTRESENAGNNIQKCICVISFASQYIPLKFGQRQRELLKAIFVRLDYCINVERLSDYRNKMIEWKRGLQQRFP